MTHWTGASLYDSHARVIQGIDIAVLLWHSRYEMRRALAITLAVPALLYSGAAFLWGWFDAFMQCDEICRADSPDWRYTSGAWQWYALGGLGASALAAGILFFRSVVRRRPWHAVAFLVLGAIAVVVGLAGFTVNPGSDQDLNFELPFFIVSAAAFVSGLAASFLAARPARRTADARAAVSDTDRRQEEDSVE